MLRNVAKIRGHFASRWGAFSVAVSACWLKMSHSIAAPIQHDAAKFSLEMKRYIGRDELSYS